MRIRVASLATVVLVIIVAQAAMPFRAVADTAVPAVPGLIVPPNLSIPTVSGTQIAATTGPGGVPTLNRPGKAGDSGPP